MRQNISNNYRTNDEMGEYLDKYFEQEPNNVTRFETVEQIFEMVDKLAIDNYFFRGVSDKSYGLQSSLERSVLDLQTEAWMIEEFDRRKHEYLKLEDYPNSKFELLALMQHYGATNRLLDITRSPYVGLYFAVSEHFKEKEIINQKDGALYSLMYWNLHSASIKNLQSGSEKFDFDYNFIARQLRENAKLFEKDFFKSNNSVAFFLEPYKVNTRLNIQQGLFLVSNRGIERTVYNLLKREKDSIGDDLTIFEIYYSL